MNLDMLTDEMTKRNITKEMLANAIGVDRATIYRKFARNGDPFTIKEARLIVQFLKLESKKAATIFFK